MAWRNACGSWAGERLKLWSRTWAGSAAGTERRTGFERNGGGGLFGEGRRRGEWQQLVEVCRVGDMVLIDQETVCSPRQINDRLPLGWKESLNEYELDRYDSVRWKPAGR